MSKVCFALVTGMAAACELFAAPPILPVRPVDIARDVAAPPNADANRLSRPTKLYTVCSLGDAEHGFIKGGKVYAPGGGGVVCWELATGKVIRRYTEISNSVTMPILEHGLLVGATGDGVRAVFAADGKRKWHTPTGPVRAEALVYWDDGKDQFVFAQSVSALCKIRLDDGKITARYPAGSICVPGLDKKNRWLYAQQSHRLAKLRADDLTCVWEVTLDGAASYSSPIVIVDDPLIGNCVFAATHSGNIYCISPEGKIVWQHSFGGLIHGLQTYFKGMLIEHGYPSIVRAVDARNGTTLWVFDSKDRYDSRETFWTAPILIGDRLLVPTADGPGRAYNRRKFFLLDPWTGKLLGEFEFDSPESSCGVPMASGGIVIFHDNIHCRWTAVKVGDGEMTDWYPFRGDEAHTGVPAHQRQIVTQWYDAANENTPWRQVRDWLFVDRFDRPDAASPGCAEFPPLPWKSQGPPGSVAVSGGRLRIGGSDGKLVGVHHEMTAAPLYTVEGIVTFHQTDAPDQWFVLLAGGWRLRLGLMGHSDGFIYYMNASRPSLDLPSDQWIRSDVRYEANRPHRFTIRVDCENQTGEYQFDGKPLGKARFAPYCRPCCIMSGTQSPQGSFYLDDLMVYRGDQKPKRLPQN
ncbi:MAG TPA: PQQ-binding-like beta-propeller repeat protein [Thermoguttaceae bacterium]|nr:PQQ-binding-like beta-propeller repeat protein [Thermoguttaceae bacterium]